MVGFKKWLNFNYKYDVKTNSVDYDIIHIKQRLINAMGGYIDHVDNIYHENGYIILELNKEYHDMKDFELYIQKILGHHYKVYDNINQNKKIIHIKHVDKHH